MSSRRRRARLKLRQRRKIMSLQIAGILAGLMLLITVVAGLGIFALTTSWLQGLPDPDAPGAFDVAQATRIYSADGKLLARLYLENRDVIPISKMSTDLVNAIIAVEDERFYEHKGVDPLGIMRAVVVNITVDFGAEGASTITQQYIRNTILMDEQFDATLARKVREAYLALELEKRFTKTQILEMYLNAIYFGEGAHGAQAASRTYFAKSADKLTLAEAALLAGLPQQPSRLDPYDNPDGAVRRRNEVLSDMRENGYITVEQMEVAQAEKLKLKRAKAPEDGIYAAPYFVAHVKKVLQEQFSKATVFKGGLKVYTSLDTRTQAYAEAAIKRKLGDSGPEAALVSIDPRNGYVKALVGGRSYSKNKFNLATQGRRQPGSSFKTFVLVTALDKGMPPTFRIDSSSPAVISWKPKAWVVSNSEGNGHGMMTLASATHASVNTVFARVAKEIGIKDVTKMAKKMGIDTKLPNYPSVSLGAGNVTPLEMASAYGTLATGGIHRDPVVITKVLNHSGEEIYVAKTKGKRVLKPEIAGAATEVLRGVITNGTARRAQIGRPAAGKTGTSQNNRDVWFVGYTPQLVTSVWVGHRKEKTIYVGGSRAFGGTVCAPIWADFMQNALKGQPKKNFPKAKRPQYNSKKFKIAKSSITDVVGKGLGDAHDELGGSQYSVIYVYSSKPKGTVLSQSYSGGRIVLRVSKGRRPSSGGGDTGGGDTGGGDTGGGDTGGGDTGGGDTGGGDTGGGETTTTP